MNVYNYEVYLTNPKTGERGWDLQFLSVFAENISEAKSIISRFVDNFDCILGLEWYADINRKDMHLFKDAHEAGARFVYTYNNMPTSLTPKN